MATSEEPSSIEDDGKDPHAVALGRKEGVIGGPARAFSLSSERRKEIARQAVAARWAKAKGKADPGAQLIGSSDQAGKNVSSRRVESTS